MTWRDLRDLLHDLRADQLDQPVLFIENLGKSDQYVNELDLTTATRDIYHGVSIGNELVLRRGDHYCRAERCH